MSEKQNDPAQIELHQRSMDRLEMLKQLEQRKRQELWCKAYGKELFEEVKRDKSYVRVKEVKEGKWNLKKVPCLALEVRFVETVGNCFQVLMRDVEGETIQGSFHPSCRDVMVKQVRKGRIVILKEVAVFAMGGGQGHKIKNYVLIVMGDCVDRVVKL